jgi:hypothetical protein
LNNNTPRLKIQEINKINGVTGFPISAPKKPAKRMPEWFDLHKEAFHKAYLVSLYIIEISLLVVEIILLIVHFTGG